MYEIIEKNQYGVLVRDEKDQFEYYLSALEAEKLESENQLMNTTIDDLYIESKCYFEVKKKLEDTQKELIDLRCELRVEKEKTNSLEAYSRSLELKIKELEATIENMNAIAINLQQPEQGYTVTSVEYFEYKLEKAIKYRDGLKDGTFARDHQYSLAYANKDVKELTNKLETAKKLWL